MQDVLVKMAFPDGKPPFLAVADGGDECKFHEQADQSGNSELREPDGGIEQLPPRNAPDGDLQQPVSQQENDESSSPLPESKESTRNNILRSFWNNIIGGICLIILLLIIWYLQAKPWILRTSQKTRNIFLLVVAFLIRIISGIGYAIGSLAGIFTKALTEGFQDRIQEQYSAV